MTVLVIGNSGSKFGGKDGQTIKTRLYIKKIEDEGISLRFIDLYGFVKNPIKKLKDIKQNIKKSDRIVLIAGKRGCRLLIPYILKINKRFKKTFVLPLVGSSVLHYSISKLSENEINDFFVNKNFSLAKPKKKISQYLRYIDYILPETQLTKEVFESFYNLSNCYILNNFRETSEVYRTNKGTIKLIFLSRIMRIKGIFDLLEAVKNVGNIHLDIYGEKYFDYKDDLLFKNYLSADIVYKGALESQEVIGVLGKYDLLVFPTRAPYEGTPGVISESLIAGTPILTSSFPQANYLLHDGFDSIFYEMFNVDDLKLKLKLCAKNVNKIRLMRKNALKSGEKFMYDYNRKDFLKYICGKNI